MKTNTTLKESINAEHRLKKLEQYIKEKAENMMMKETLVAFRLWKSSQNFNSSSSCTQLMRL